MNQKGRDYIKDIGAKFNSLPSKIKAAYVPPSDSLLLDRCQRLGIESRLFELVDNEHYEIAEWSLKEDFYNRNK